MRSTRRWTASAAPQSAPGRRAPAPRRAAPGHARPEGALKFDRFRCSGVPPGDLARTYLSLALTGLAVGLARRESRYALPSGAMAAIRPNENFGWFPRSSRAREVRLREDSAALLRDGYLLSRLSSGLRPPPARGVAVAPPKTTCACKEREKASRKTAQGAVSLPANSQLQA